MSAENVADGGFRHRFIRGTSDRVLLLLHGTGGDEESLLPLADEVDPLASVLTVRGKVLENGMPRFFRRFAEGVFDLEDLRYRAQELADFVVWASKKYDFRLESVTALGYSNGANIGAAVLLLRPDVMGGGILMRPVLPLKPSVLPKLSGKRVFVSAGRSDPMSPREGTLALVELLKEGGADVTLNWEDASHSLRREELEKARAWLADAE